MPTYEYACTACGHEFETFQSIKADVLTDCPSCGKPKLKRKIGLGAGIIFKGGGFYETDYRRKAKPAEGAVKSSGEAGAPSKPKETKASGKPSAAAV